MDHRSFGTASIRRVLRRRCYCQRIEGACTARQASGTSNGTQLFPTYGPQPDAVSSMSIQGYGSNRRTLIAAASAVANIILALGIADTYSKCMSSVDACACKLTMQAHHSEDIRTVSFKRLMLRLPHAKLPNGYIGDSREYRCNATWPEENAYAGMIASLSVSIDGPL